MHDLRQGDCREVMRGLDADSIDAIVTDPPYELGFMGKGWDKSGIANDPDMWGEALRVLKPGGYLLAFSGSRTYHRMACAIEDAGFEIRDQIMWVYGSGFPKSRNIGGGWGTALKPAHEPIVIARKPLQGTVAANVAKWDTGALNIDGCRVAGTPDPTRFDPAKHSHAGYRMNATGAECAANASPLGRWPANLIHDGSDEVLAAFAAAGEKGGGHWHNHRSANAVYGKSSGGSAEVRNDGTGTAARFFYCAKSSKADRDAGLESYSEHGGNANRFDGSTPGLGARGLSRLSVEGVGEHDATFPRPPHNDAGGDHSLVGMSNGAKPVSEGVSKHDGIGYNHAIARNNMHPTVKPTALMRYLCRLVTPPGGIILDPFMGSGSTGRGAILEGFSFIGIETDPNYIAIAERRIAHAEREPAPDLFSLIAAE